MRERRYGWGLWGVTPHSANPAMSHSCIPSLLPPQIPRQKTTCNMPWERQAGARRQNARLQAQLFPLTGRKRRRKPAGCHGCGHRTGCQSRRPRTHCMFLPRAEASSCRQAAFSPMSCWGFLPTSCWVRYSSSFCRPAWEDRSTKQPRKSQYSTQGYPSS